VTARPVGLGADRDFYSGEFFRTPGNGLFDRA
jgi:hypothetical protein